MLVTGMRIMLGFSPGFSESKYWATKPCASQFYLPECLCHARHVQFAAD
jgi:hypothetical protein